MKTKFTTEEIINSLDGIHRAEPDPFLYTRVHARMLRNENSTVTTILRYITKPSFVMALVMLVILVNGYIMFNRIQMQENQEEMNQSIAAEYGRQNAINPYELNEAP